MLEDKINKKREELNESLEKNKNYDTTYKLSVELDELISQFYGMTKEKNKKQRTIRKKKDYNKILYIA